MGGLINNQWSFAGDRDRDSVNEMLIQPFVNYNIEDGWYLTSSPIITANWAAKESKDVWTVPVGGGVGRLFHLGKLPVNVSVQAFDYVEKPEFGADWESAVCAVPVAEVKESQRGRYSYGGSYRPQAISWRLWEGQYGAVGGTASVGDLWLKNEKGVVMRLKAKREGLMLAVGADVIDLHMTQ